MVTDGSSRQIRHNRQLPNVPSESDLRFDLLAKSVCVAHGTN